MNENTEKMIRELAEKLGTTVENLWHVLIKQASIDAITQSVILLLCIIVLIFCFRIAKKFFLRFQESDETSDLLLFMLFVAFSAILLIHGLVIISNFGLVLSGFFNPEFWALKQIIK